MIHFSKKIKKDLIVGYLDYEKAFDYANRANIVLKLMSKGCGQTFTSAVTKMFKSTTYIPTTNNKICDELQPHMVSHKEGTALQIFTPFMFLKCLVAQMNLVI